MYEIDEKSGNIFKVIDENTTMIFPPDESNPDYQAYLAYLAELEKEKEDN